MLSEVNRLAIALFIICVMLAAVRALRKRELSLSTGVVWLGAGFIGLIPLFSPKVLRFLTDVIGAKFPASALTMYTFLFFAAVLLILAAKLEKALMCLISLERSVSLLERRIRLLEEESNVRTKSDVR